MILISLFSLVTGAGGRILCRNTHIAAAAYLGLTRHVSRSFVDLITLLNIRQTKEALSWIDFSLLAQSAGVKVYIRQLITYVVDHSDNQS